MSLTGKLGHCDDCGVKLQFDTPEQKRESNKYQKKYSWNDAVFVSCDDCIAKNHTITDEEIKGIQIEKGPNLA